MALSQEIRKLENKWRNREFPKHLRYVELHNIRGWTGQRIEFDFPIVAIVGENGAGKSTIIQAAASVYKSPSGNGFYPSVFFPDTAWDKVTNVDIKASVKEGDKVTELSIRKPTTIWRGYDSRRERCVVFLDLRRAVPLYSQKGYSRLAKRQNREAEAELLHDEPRARLGTVLGKNYSLAKQSTTDFDTKTKISVLGIEDLQYSKYHQGTGESIIFDFMASEIPEYSIVLIDEIETSLHPRAQRRLIRDLATLSRIKHVQFIVTTHSAYVLDELPLRARIQILDGFGVKKVVYGVSSEFALSQMDEENHPEMDIFVEDTSAKILLEEIIASVNLSLLSRVQIISYGAANVGKALGIMISEKRFPRPTLVFLDGDQDMSSGCFVLPGDDAPERVVYTDLLRLGLPGVAENLVRPYSDLISNCQIAITLSDHHDWNKAAADRVICSKDDLWRALCRSWVAYACKSEQKSAIIEALQNVLDSVQK